VGEINVALGVVFWAAANVGERFQGAQPLNPAWRSRFDVLRLAFPSQPVLEAILARALDGVDKGAYHAHLLSRIGVQARRNPISTVDVRQLLSAAAHLAAGADLNEAIAASFQSAFDSADSDAGEVAIREAVALALRDEEQDEGASDDQN